MLHKYPKEEIVSLENQKEMIKPSRSLFGLSSI